jgi:hypothetical protein
VVWPPLYLVLIYHGDSGGGFPMQCSQLRIGFGVADATGAHRPTHRGVRIKGVKAQLRVGSHPAAGIWPINDRLNPDPIRGHDSLTSEAAKMIQLSQSNKGPRNTPR